MMDKNQLLEKKRISQQFLHLAYLRCNGLRLNNLIFRSLMEAIGLKEDYFVKVEDYLSAKDYLKRIGLGGVNGSFELTHEGIKKVEADIMAGGYALENTVGNERIPSAGEMEQLVGDRRRIRADFLWRVYELSDGSPVMDVKISDVIEGMDLSEVEYNSAEDFLSDEYLIERTSLGGLSGSIELTNWGKELVEEALLSDEELLHQVDPQIADEEQAILDEGIARYPKWFPKSKDRREMWRDAYRFMEEMKREYYSDDEFYDKPEPSDEEYADRLAARMKWKPKPRTIRNVKRAGKIGLFE